MIHERRNVLESIETCKSLHVHERCPLKWRTPHHLVSRLQEELNKSKVFSNMVLISFNQEHC